ncbi:hypothetical protein FOVG_19963 [Fusarium oxysporum f. sp. pisi HDV247]|uniref:Zn(2)-C6 fungal-type domain-containing protein n=1 Tax=Fusarium oxysporum f. sp. pisi HDV247 TaxID=1080344 RepID=W9NCJ9_FUSOX|nr:hypothetical protein FOVG_19963 [Fusarium oxysporum f. sp. pisi HDV247]
MAESAISEENSQASCPARISFLPVNDPASPPRLRRRRAQLSCEKCRRRKSRCEIPDGQSKTCLRCLREGETCDFRSVKYKRRGTAQASSPTVTNPAARRSSTSAVNGQPAGYAIEPTEPEHASRVEAAPSQRPWLGVDAAPGETQHGLRSDDQQASWRHAQAIHPADPHDSPVASTDGAARLDSRARIISAQVDNPADALNLLTLAASEEQYSAGFPPPEQSGASETLERSISQKENGRPDSLPEHDFRWSNFKFVQQRLIAVCEAIEFTDFFFSRLWPLRPVVPAYYNDRSKYVLLVAEEPVLLEAIITLASRYHVLSGNHGQIRSERIHWGAWRSLQKCLQSAMWGSTKTRSLGTIASMLLLIDWHTKAINNPGAFSSEDDGYACDMLPEMRGNDAQANPPTSLNSKQGHGMAAHLESLGITPSAYRSNKMSWMLLANAIALAREGCCFELETPGLLDSMDNHKTVNRDWARVICVFIYLADEHLALRLDLEPLLPETSRKIVVDRFSKVFTRSLPEKEHWESYFELTEEMRKAREYLHELKKTASRPYHYDLVPALVHTQRRLECWKRQFERLGKGCAVHEVDPHAD